MSSVIVTSPSNNEFAASPIHWLSGSAFHSAVSECSLSAQNLSTGNYTTLIDTFSEFPDLLFQIDSLGNDT